MSQGALRLLAHGEDALQAVGLLAEEVVLARDVPRADAQRVNISTCTAQALRDGPGST